MHKKGYGVLRALGVVAATTCIGLVLIPGALAEPSEKLPAGPPAIIGKDGLPHAAAMWDAPLTQSPTGVSSPDAPSGVLSTCSPGYRYAGYIRSSLPATGDSAYVGVTWNTTTLYDGHVVGWVGVTNDAATRWMQAGLARYKGDASVSKYIEYWGDGGYSWVPKGSASPGTSYFASVTKVAVGQWTASIGGSALGYNVGVSGMTNTQFLGEAQQSVTTNCNVMDVNFSDSSWTTGSMTKTQNSPYVADSITSTGWRSHGG